MSFSKLKNKTFFRYLLSYLIILSITFSGFYFAVQTEIKQEYLARLNMQNRKSLESLYDLIDSQLKSISQITLSLHQNSTLLLSRYENGNYSNYLTVGELKKYSTGNSLIYDTFYLDKNTETVLTTKRHARIREERLEVYADGRYTGIALDELNQISHGRLIALNSSVPSDILFVPGQESTSALYLYDLNRHELQRLLETGLSDGIFSISIMDLEGNPLLTVNSTDINVDTEESTLSYTISPYTNCFQIYAISSKPALFGMVNDAFQRTYWLMALLGIIGLFVISLSMRITYLPLRSLAKNLTGNKNDKEDYYRQIENAFEDTRQEKKLLEEKINDYRVMMQRSIFDNVIANNNESPEILEKIDALFRAEDTSALFIAIIYTRRKELSSVIIEGLSQSLPAGSFSLQLEKEEDRFLLLINYAGTETSKEAVLTMYLEECARQFCCSIALSDLGSTPMEIPSLYENAQLAALQRKKSCISTYTNFSGRNDEITKKHYPYHDLEIFTGQLNDLSFTAATQTLEELLFLIAEQKNAGFYTQCLLIDILTIIISTMNQNNIRFEKYREIYLQTLFFCRSCNYSDKKDDIDKNLLQLMKLFEEETASITLHMPAVKKFVDDNYTASSFSVTLLADHFHVSPAYMSYLFKNFTGNNLSDYVWQLRLEKACELLTVTENSIDVISAAVGYENASSFRRKFKQETGLTPSEYRKKGT